MQRIDFLTSIHTAAKRDYVQRVVEHDKAACAEVALRRGKDYWDGERQYGYGGYRYDGRWLSVAEELARHYGLKAGDKVLDIGCGKAFLLYELTQAVPGIDVTGIDISEYGITHAKQEVQGNLDVGICTELPYDDGAFDFVYSINTFHNLPIQDLFQAVRELVRVARGPAYICVESFRNETEKTNLLYWQLTCRGFHDPDEWEWIYGQCGYAGDAGFIYFE